MPTGYTANLEETLKWDVERWLIEQVPRAFGCLVELRDSANDMTEEQILAHLEDEVNDTYYAKQLPEREKDLRDAEMMDDAAWEREFEGHVTRGKREFAEKTKEQAAKREQYDVALALCRKFKAFAGDRLGSDFESILGFPIEQLDMVSNEYDSPNERWHLPPTDTWQEYKKVQVELLADNITYARRELAAERERANTRLRFYLQWRDMVRRFFKEIKAKNAQA